MKSKTTFRDIENNAEVVLPLARRKEKLSFKEFNKLAKKVAKSFEEEKEFMRPKHIYVEEEVKTLHVNKTPLDMSSKCICADILTINHIKDCPMNKRKKIILHTNCVYCFGMTKPYKCKNCGSITSKEEAKEWRNYVQKRN